MNVTRLPFAGLSRGDTLVGSPAALLNMIEPPARPMEAVLERDRAIRTRIDALFREEPLAELSMIHELSRLIGARSDVFLGNSLPIREWDLAATWQERDIAFRANRGANGIDGAVSTFLGAARAGRDNWAIVGDLTMLYDLSAPWIVPQLPAELVFRIVVVNNGGGRIFSRVPSLDGIAGARREKFFENGHHISFGGWAQMWDLSYERWVAIPRREPQSSRCVIELVPDPAASTRLWQRFDKLWRKIG